MWLSWPTVGTARPLSFSHHPDRMDIDPLQLVYSGRLRARTSAVEPAGEIGNGWSNLLRCKLIQHTNNRIERSFDGYGDGHVCRSYRSAGMVPHSMICVCIAKYALTVLGDQCWLILAIEGDYQKIKSTRKPWHLLGTYWTFSLYGSHARIICHLLDWSTKTNRIT